ncbi:hypothetical protein OG453_38560 [Streptomyces sp. NBC_01381]|uniref:hypothetical protein n=1 Tax=Streptomyces sp. NBC_01381 TaxID=2903845 RepID=UPI002250733C|nr:hypothetical protein [Streptomyces sp. NBC_01381]MCX4672485.1 hypothetical protein [Streptomyces sp. NBC_01381]
MAGSRALPQLAAQLDAEKGNVAQLVDEAEEDAEDQPVHGVLVALCQQTLMSKDRHAAARFLRKWEVALLGAALARLVRYGVFVKERR